MQLHELKSKTKRQLKKRVGRGGKRGKTSGRGTKGQKARSGHRIRAEVRDQIKKLPKLRGHGTNRARTINDSSKESLVVNLGTLEENFSAGEKVTPSILRQRKLISLRKGDTTRVIKVLGKGVLTKKLSISGCVLSKSARTHVENVGGTILDPSA